VEKLEEWAIEREVATAVALPTQEPDRPVEAGEVEVSSPSTKTTP
jgi:hypothetical protein